jgi:hypothetical protein
MLLGKDLSERGQSGVVRHGSDHVSPARVDLLDRAEQPSSLVDLAGTCGVEERELGGRPPARPSSARSCVARLAAR